MQKKKRKKALTLLNSYLSTYADNWKCLLIQGCWQAASWRLLQYEMLLSSHDGRNPAHLKAQDMLKFQ